MMRSPLSSTRRVPSSLVLVLRSLVGAAIAVTITGCSPAPDGISLIQRTNGPPAMTATLVSGYEPDDPNLITLSDGVVMSVGCWNTCDYTCEQPSLTSAQPGVLEVRSTFRLDGDRPEHVLIAVEPGTTTLTVSDTCASRDYQVTVLQP